MRALPGGKAKRIDVKGHPGFEACDPGPGVDMKVTGRSSDVLVLPNVWGYLVAEAVPQLGPAGSRCFAGQIMQGLTYQQLNDPAQQDALTKVVAQRAVSAYAACGSKPALAVSRGALQRASSASRSRCCVVPWSICSHTERGTAHITSNSLPSGSVP